MEIEYKLLYHTKVLKIDISNLDISIKQRIKFEIEKKLQFHPEIFGKHLRKSLKGYRKLRVGEYRVIFKIEKSQVYIIKIAHRSEVYDRLKLRFDY